MGTTSKEVERTLVVSLCLSCLALTLAILCFPVLQNDLEALTLMVHRDVDEFKESTDSIWSDILELQVDSRREKRSEDEGKFVYKYHPSLRQKLKRIRLALHGKGMHHRRKSSTAEEHNSLKYNRTEAKEWRKSHPQWGKRVMLGIRGSLPRSKPYRIHSAPTVESKPGRQVFSDAEFIGQLEPMNAGKPKRQHQCRLRPDPKCPSGPPGAPGADGQDGENGTPGTDGKHGLDGTLQSEEASGCILCPVGERGPKGATGPRGEEGIPGLPGRPGMRHELPGPPGPPGYAGEQGEPGPRGPPGQPGVSVKKWISPPGEKGLPGGKGLRGPAGPRGPTGEMGIQGVKGRRGPFGMRGVQGPPGDRGLAGPMGRPGFDEHYCECPLRSKVYRGRFEFPKGRGGNYPTASTEGYPHDVFLDRRL